MLRRTRITSRSQRVRFPLQHTEKHPCLWKWIHLLCTFITEFWNDMAELGFIHSDNVLDENAAALIPSELSN